MRGWRWAWLGSFCGALIGCSNNDQEPSGEPDDVRADRVEVSTLADGDDTAALNREASITSDDCVVVVERVELNGLGQAVMHTFTTYDFEGRLLTDGQDWAANGSLDVLYQRTYSAEGLLLDETQDCQVDGVIDRRERYVYNADSVLIAREWDTGDDGKLDQLSTYRRDVAGRRTTLNIDVGVDGTIDWQLEGEYDDAGHLVRETLHDLRTSTVAWVVSRVYDDRGNVVEQVIDEADDGAIDEHLTLLYDDAGNRVRVERTDLGGNVGWFDYTYSPEGNVLSEEWGGHGRGVHWWKRWTYSSSCGEAAPAEALSKIRLQGEGPDRVHVLRCG